MSTITQTIELAINALRHNDIVAIPTETVYGLAGNAENEDAIKAIFAIKHRPLNHPLIMHVAKHQSLEKWVEFIPDYAKQLMEAFWPGPLTLVMTSKPDSISPLITGGQPTIAIRCPAHPVAQTLLSALDFPLVAPSANPFGKISPTTAQHVQDSFEHESFLILDGGRCGIGIESTIVNATHPLGYEILRAGMINEHSIKALLPHVQQIGSSAIRVPGKLDTHYQPEKPLYCFNTSEELQQFCLTHTPVYVLSFTNIDRFKAKAGYQLPNNPEELAYELYYQLRCADQSEADCIAIELPTDNPAFTGIRERMLKASTR